MKRFWQVLFIIALCSFQPLPSLELKRVILSTNDNPNYIEFWPIVAPLWQAMGLRPTLALVANDDCQVDTTLGDVIRFPPLGDVSEALQTQVIRLMLPVLFPHEGCLIADIDMLPISRDYFFDGAVSCPSDAFLVYRDRAYGEEVQKYPMCYVAAEGHVFSSLFGIAHSSKFPALIRHLASQGYGWYTDELILYRYLMQWEKSGNHIVRLGHNAEQRLDRSDWNTAEQSIENYPIENYIDCHCPRPYSAYKSSIDKIVQAIYTWWNVQNPN